MLQFEKQNEDALRTLLSGLSARDAVLNYQQIHGLLFAVANSPEPIPTAEWFELIWLSDDPQFDDPAEAKMFYRLLVNLFDAISGEVQAARYQPGVGRRGHCTIDNLADWCDGFLIGHHYLEDLWAVALDDLNDEQLYEQVDAALIWAEAFIDGAIVDDETEDTDDRFLAEHLHFQQLLESYRAVRARFGNGKLHFNVEKVFRDMQPAEHNEPCLCGSGRLFRRCCLH